MKSVLKFILSYIQLRCSRLIKERRSYSYSYSYESECVVYRLDGAIDEMVKIEEFLKGLLRSLEK